tara:strand:+ start:535 stop:681 length:147 start_codon:yes stop_codon:yes gene_type:complete
MFSSRRKASKKSGEVALNEKKKSQEAEEKARKEESRARLAAKAAMFGK